MYPGSLSNVHFTLYLFMGKIPVLLCIEAWCVHICVAAQTNGALVHQKGLSRPVYKLACYAIHQIILLHRRGSSLRWLWKKPRSLGRRSSSSAHRRRINFSIAFVCAMIVAYAGTPCVRRRGTVTASTVSALPTQRLCSLKAHAPFASVWVFPVSARGSPFSMKAVPLAQPSRFHSLLREKNSRAASPSQQAWVVSCRLSARVLSPRGVFHTGRPAPLFGCKWLGLIGCVWTGHHHWGCYHHPWYRRVGSGKSLTPLKLWGWSQKPNSSTSCQMWWRI